MKHTPWVAEEQDHSWCVHIGENFYACENVSEAEARLIAAAPELLEALQSLLSRAEYLYGMAYYSEPDSHTDDVAFNAVRAAIAKAKGEA